MHLCGLFLLPQRYTEFSQSKRKQFPFCGKKLFINSRIYVIGKSNKIRLFHTMNEKLQIWLIEDNKTYRETVFNGLNQRTDLECDRMFGSAEAALTQLEQKTKPEVILTDIGLPGISGVQAIPEYRKRAPNAQIIMLTVHEEDDQIFEAICNGANGYLLKSAGIDEICDAIYEVRGGGAPVNARIARKILTMFSFKMAPVTDYGLTEREKEILQKLVEGKSKKIVANELFVSYHTVDTHLRNIYQKLQVHTRGLAVAKAVKERLV